MSGYSDLTNKYRMLYDIHTHTTFSHGKGSVEDNVKAAVTKGLSVIGISDHGPGHLTYGVKPGDFPKMRAEVERLKPLYPDIEILLGVEANIINPSGNLDIKKEEFANFDYILAGYHYGIFGEEPLQAAKAHIINFWSTFIVKNRETAQKKINTGLVIRALYENDIKVQTHPGDKGQFDILPIANACAKTGTLMEISTWHDAPTEEDLRIIGGTDAAFIISSDAHSPERVGTFIPGLERALKAGIDPARIKNLEEI